MKYLTFLLVFILISCATMQFNQPQWSTSIAELATIIDTGPWEVDADAKVAVGVVKLSDMGASFDHQKIDDLILYINGGSKTETVQIDLLKFPVQSTPQLWYYEYDDVVNKLIAADIDTTRGKCQAVLEVHYDKNTMVFYVAPAYLAFNDRLNFIELIDDVAYRVER